MAKKVFDSKSILIVAAIIVVLAIGFFVGSGMQKQQTGTPQQPLEEISSDKQAEQSETDLGNKMSGATGSIDQIIGKAK